MTHKEFLEIMAVLEVGSGTSKPISELQAEVYFDILKDLPAESVRRAARQALSESQYPTIPPVGVLLKLATGEVPAESRATIAYAAAARAVQTQGGYRSVDFDDPLVNATIRLMGGWDRFCDWPVDEVQWRKRDFERMYLALSQAGVEGELVGSMPGIIEMHNSPAGYVGHVPDAVMLRVGIPPTPRRLIRGEPQKRLTVAAIEREVGKLVSCLDIPDGMKRPAPEVHEAEPLSDERLSSRSLESILNLQGTAPVLAPEDAERMETVNATLGRLDE